MQRITPAPINHRIPRPVFRGRRILAALGLAAGIVCLAYFMQLHAEATATNSLARIHQPVPSLVVESSGINVDLRNFVQGTRCVVVFHSPSCGTCRKVLPTLHPIPAGIRLILVNESPGSEDTQIGQFPGAAHFADSHGALARSFREISLPIILFIDEHGILRECLAGSHQRDYVRKKLKDFAVNPYGNRAGNP